MSKSSSSCCLDWSPLETRSELSPCSKEFCSELLKKPYIPGLLTYALLAFLCIGEAVSSKIVLGIRLHYILSYVVFLVLACHILHNNK